MQPVQKQIPAGLRERKRTETHARIQAEAIRLFLERGFETTTLDDIAEAAGVSRRSLFHYFEFEGGDRPLGQSRLPQNHR